MRRFRRLVLQMAFLPAALALGAEHSKKAEKGATAAPIGGVEKTNFLQWPNSFVLSGSTVKAVVVPAYGGRILQYTIKGENILLDNEVVFSPAAAGGSAHRWAGGYQSEVVPDGRLPMLDERLSTGPYESLPSEEFGVTLRSEPDPRLQLQLEKEIIIDPESGELGITQRLRNVSSNEVAHCLWDRTQCPGGGFAFFPLRKKSAYPAKWALRKSADGPSAYDGAKPHSPNVQVQGNLLIARCDGEPTKLGADSDAGWIAYVRGRLLFVKYFPFNNKGRYTDSGNTVEVYFDQSHVELGVLSPEAKLHRGEAFDFPEKWALIELDGRVSSFGEVRSLVNKVPESPFK